MGLIALIRGERHEGLSVAIDVASRSVRVFDHANPNLTTSPAFEIAYPFSEVPEYSDSDYYVVLFGYASWPQSKVLTLRHNANPVGALFSIEVLSSGFANDPDVSDKRKKTMEQYAAISLRKMCKGEVRGLPLVDVEIKNNSAIPISYFYHPDTVVAIFTIRDFFPDEIQSSHDANKYNEFFLGVLPSFYCQGLFPTPWAGSAPSEEAPVRYRKFNGRLGNNAQERNFKLEKFSDDLPNDSKEFLLTIFQEIDPHEINPFFRFFLYYQVFELWMQEIFVQTICTFRTAIASAESEDTTLFREKLYALNSALNEKARLAIVLTSNALSGPDSDLLLSACNDVLIRCGQPVKTNLHEAIYGVRNRLVHGFNQAKIATTEFDTLADMTLELICHISMTYSPPPASTFD